MITLTKSKLTVNAYKTDIVYFLSYSVKSGVKKINQVTAQHVINYLGHCKNEGKSDATLNRYYMAIRSYVRFLVSKKIIQVNFMDEVAAPKNHQRAPKVPSAKNIEQLMNTTDLSTESGLRDRAILELLYSSGLRVSELCDLKMGDVRYRTVIIRCGKRNKTRTVPMTESALFYIEEYLTKYRGDEEGYIFLTLQDKIMRRQFVAKMIAYYAKKTGLNFITPHSLRHACATHLLNHGADIRFIQEVLGHSSIASTQRYTQLSSVQMEEMFERYHPRKSW